MKYIVLLVVFLIVVQCGLTLGCEGESRLGGKCRAKRKRRHSIDAHAYIVCGDKTYYSNPRMFICCGGRLKFKARSFSVCCGSKSYNPAAEECCGGLVFLKSDINSGCCYGKFYQRGEKMCCGRKLIDVETHGCCRNEPFDKTFEACCDGDRIPNLFDDPNEPFQCCGKEMIQPRFSICCAEKVAPRVAGIFTRCCKEQTYDIRRESCCRGQPIAKSRDKDQCCFGKMINSRTDICCNYRSHKRIYKDTGCCRMGTWAFEIYDNNDKICCSRRIEKRPAGKSSSCCNQKAYDVKTQICCGFKIYDRTSGTTERCCGNIPYDRSNRICCKGKLKDLRKEDKRYTFCCGSKKYDRRQFECKKAIYCVCYAYKC